MKRSRFGAVMVLVAPALICGCSSEANSAEFIGTWAGDSGQVLILKSNGDATGNDGCNDFGAEWKSTGESVGELRVKEMTLKACAEGKSWGQTARLELSDNEITIKDEAGTDLGRLTRVGVAVAVRTPGIVRRRGAAVW